MGGFLVLVQTYLLWWEAPCSWAWALAGCHTHCCSLLGGSRGLSLIMCTCLGCRQEPHHSVPFSKYSEYLLVASKRLRLLYLPFGIFAASAKFWTFLSVFVTPFHCPTGLASRKMPR